MGKVKELFSLRGGVRPLQDRLKSAVRACRSARALFEAYGYDGRRYISFSGSVSVTRSKQTLRAAITERSHSIEKGLSLPDPRPKFGSGAIFRLTELSQLYVERFGVDATIQSASGAMSKYLEYHARIGIEPDDLPLGESVLEFWRGVSADSLSGICTVERKDVIAATSSTGLEFFRARHSVRQFGEGSVSDDQIREAVRIAMTAPAVCNREFSHVHTFRDPSTVARLLEFQGGARGFSEGVPAVAMITVSLSSYWDATQRNQGWVDGGAFAMAFLLGLHSLGLGTIPLNWSKLPEQDRGVRRIVQLPEEESIIMFVGFGPLPPEFNVAASRRVPLEEFWRDES